MDKETTLELIDETIHSIDRFDALDQEKEIIEPDQFERLYIQKDNLKKLHHKLDTGELEVAVVGLEKAGKSKFSSAFVNKPGLFPSADERCTFTSTALRYGSQDMARVEFYSKKDFYDKVSAMLADVEYPYPSIDGLQADSFRRYFDALRETRVDLYNRHASKTEIDILDIIEGLSKIKSLLGQEEKTFHDLSSEELRGYITDKHVSRAVRNVTFYSTELQGLENIVLYDVPGFDSPTLVHINETIDKLKQVDAIVMVKNIKMPSLKGTEVDILVKNSDMDGVPLSDKLFVFGSWADAVESPEKLEQNIKTLSGDLGKSLRKTFDRQRLFTGSLDPEKAKEWSERGGQTQTEELKGALRQYNERERSQVLAKRINRSVEEVKTVLRSIVENTQMDLADRSEESGIILDLLDESRRHIDKELTHFINPKKARFQEERAFTQRVIEGIDACMPQLDESFIENTLHEIQSSDTRNVIDFTRLNLELRGRMATQIKEAVVNLVLDVSREDARQIEEDIFNIVLEAMDVKNGHPRYEEISAAMREFLKKETATVSIRDAAFKPLIERFIVDLIDTMIQKPLRSDARYERFMKGKPDLYMLSMFSAGAGFDLPYRSPLVAAVLAQKQQDENYQDLFEQYRDQFRRAIPSSAQSDDALGHLVRQLVSTLADVAISRVIPLTEVREMVKAVQTQGIAGEGMERIAGNFAALFEKLGGGGKDLVQSEKSYLDFLLRDVTQANNEADVKKEIETDLRNLVVLFKDCVVSAMNLELPFISAITLFNERTREIFQGRAYRDFLKAHVHHIRRQEFEQIDDKKARREIRADLINEMRNILVRLERGFIVD